MMTRAEHTDGDEKRLCRRCGLSVKIDNGRCPPGYWMTKSEIAEWSALSSLARREMENDLGSQPAPRRMR